MKKVCRRRITPLFDRKKKTGLREVPIVISLFSKNVEDIIKQKKNSTVRPKQKKMTHKYLQIKIERHRNKYKLKSLVCEAKKHYDVYKGLICLLV